MTRGGALAAMSAAALAGCTVKSSVVRGISSLRGCVDVPVPDARGVQVVRGIVPTKHVAGPLRYAIVVPDGGQRIDRVAYLLPGRGGTADSAVDVGFDGFLARFLREGGKPFAIAALDAGESYFHPRASGEDRLAAATVDLPRAVARVLGVQPRREALIGQSMGGYGALLAAERQPGRYCAVAVAGPAIFPSYEDERRSVGDAFDSATDYARHDVTTHAAQLRGTPVHISIGARDPFLPGVNRFARAYPDAQLIVSPGCHDEGFWRASASRVVAFAGTRLALRQV